MDKKYLSKLTINGSQYDLKDAEARQDIVDIKSSITGAMHWAGFTTTALTDGATTNPIIIGGESYTAKAGDVVAIEGDTYEEEKEFVFNGTKWQKMGPAGSFKALAFKDSATGDVVVSGSNAASAVSFSGTTSETVLKAVDSAAVAPSFSEGAFDAGSLPSLGSATTGSFATEGIVASVNEANELLTLSSASTASAVTAQGTFDAGSLPSKAADTFNAGSAATFTTESVITGLGTATAAAQVFSGSTVSVTVS